MKRLILGLITLGLLSSSTFAKEVKVCNVTKNFTPSVLEMACEGDLDNTTTLKEMYKMGWKFVGTSLSGSGGQVVILEK